MILDGIVGTAWKHKKVLAAENGIESIHKQT
jgi:hypothetical protein